MLETRLKLQLLLFVFTYEIYSKAIQKCKGDGILDLCVVLNVVCPVGRNGEGEPHSTNSNCH